MVSSSSSKRFPSPISMRQNPNPNPNPNPNLNPNSRNNNQEKEGFGVRKSFCGYPFAKSSIISQPKSPAAEYGRRSSIGRECGESFGDHEQKENERDPNSRPVGRVRSPSISKGAKNFMSPTISAASKINPSPRKKVLGERNEAIRTSASLSDGRFHFFSSNSLEFDDENESKVVGLETPPSTNFDFKFNNSEVSNIDYEKKAAELSPGVGKIESESDLVVVSPEIPLNNATKSSETLPLSDMPKIVADNNVDFDNKKTTDSSSPMIAPLDADPCYKPYDPKTNYLSPRPQFLHYKPKPRIGAYINQGISLEDDLASESVSETETSEDVQSEETSSVGTSVVEEELPSSELSSAKSEQLEGDVEAVGTSVVEEELPSSELSSAKSEQLEDDVEAEIEPRSGFGGKWKLVSLLFVILVGSISFSMYSPGVGNAIYQHKMISQFYNYPRMATDLAKENINSLLTYSKVWTAQSVGYLSQMIHKERDVKFSPLPFSNLSGWQEEEFEDFVVKGFELGPFDRKEGGFDSEMAKVTDNEIGKYPELAKHEKCSEETVLIELDEAETLEESSGTLALFNQGVESSEPEKLDDHPVLEDEHSAFEMEEHPSLLNEPEDKESGTTDQVIGASEPENLEVSPVLEDSVIVDGQSAVVMSEQPLFDWPEIPESEHTDEEYDTTVQYESQSDTKVEDTEVHPQVTTASEPFSEESYTSAVQYESQSDSKVEDTTADTTAVQYESQSDSKVEDTEVHPQFTIASESFSEAAVESSERSLGPIAAAISAVVVSVGLAATAFVLAKKPKKETSVVSTPLAAQIVHKEKSTCMPAASAINSKVHENPSFLSSPVEVEMIGESCPSELSSFQEASSYYNKRDSRGHDEAQSEQRIKRNSKRESLASSSSEYTMTSSYGSFTTYSILHDKQRHDEVVTPVRRSSRIIRSKVTSP